MPRAPTYAQAQDHLLNVLQLQNWDVARTDARGKKLKVPHATRGRARIYFKTQSLHFDCGPPFSLNSALSTHDDPRELAELVGDDSVLANKMSWTLEGRCLRDRFDNPCECDDIVKGTRVRTPDGVGAVFKVGDKISVRFKGKTANDITIRHYAPSEVVPVGSERSNNPGTPLSTSELQVRILRLRSNEAYALLDRHPEIEGSTWTAGGCWVLAEALHNMVPKSELVAVMSNGRPQHVLVKWKGRYWDADGSSSKAELLDRWEHEESVASPYVESFDPADAWGGLVCPVAAVRDTQQLLEERMITKPSKNRENNPGPITTRAAYVAAAKADRGGALNAAAFTKAMGRLERHMRAMYGRLNWATAVRESGTDTVWFFYDEVLAEKKGTFNRKRAGFYDDITDNPRKKNTKDTLERHLREMADETGVEWPVSSDERKIPYKGRVIEVWYNQASASPWAWTAWVKGIGESIGTSEEEAIIEAKAKVDRKARAQSPGDASGVYKRLSMSTGGYREATTRDELFRAMERNMRYARTSKEIEHAMTQVSDALAARSLAPEHGDDLYTLLGRSDLTLKQARRNNPGTASASDLVRKLKF
jgi:hypothetical protein